jgi:hypothetical protein
MKIPTRHTIERRLNAAKAVFLVNDSELLHRSPSHGSMSERAMTHKFAEAMQNVFRNWHVDCEYNRDGTIPKRIVDLPKMPGKTVLPDIIVHKRNPFGRQNENLDKNLLVIEAKPSDAKAKSKAYDKLKLHRYITGGLRYKYGVLLTFVIGDEPEVEFEIYTPQHPPYLQATTIS